MRQFFFPGLRRDFRAVKLGEASLLVRARAGEFEAVVWEQRHHRLARLHLNRFGGRERFAFLRLRHDAGGRDDLAKFARAAIGDRRFVRVQFDDRVVNSKTRERGEDMLDRVDFYISLCQSRRAVGVRDIFHARLDLRLAVEIHAAEAHPAVGGRGQDGHVHPVAAVKAGAGKGRGAVERLLIEHARLDKMRARLARLHLFQQIVLDASTGKI